MAATAHAFLVSLMNTMDQIQIHPFLSPCFDGYVFESLRRKVDFFLEFVENYSDAGHDEAGDLVRRIAVSAHEAEDIIEVEAAERMRGSTRTSLTFMLRLQIMLGGMNSIEEEVIEVKEEGALFVNSTAPPPPPPPPAAAPTSTKAANMVGFDTHLAQILDELTSSDSGRRILPIVGMKGIGKTTLTRNVYENSLTLHRFDVRAWVTASQAFTLRDLFLQAISCLGSSSSNPNKSDRELGDELHKILYGRRYPAVLDDMWSIEAWEKIKFYFPDNNNGSRIVVTTRQQELVDYFASSSLAVNLLDDRNSWDLFCDKTFAQEGCPPELEDVGWEIVRKCKGLPLAITVIGGLLGKSPKAKEYWEKIARDKSLILEDSGNEGNSVLSILYLSYKNLPVWLKSCFLYLGLFPVDHHIDVSLLIQLLIADGFIKANRKQSLEEVVESHIKELVDRNLLLVGDLRLNKKFRTCYLHDVMREMCIKIAEKENFYSVQRDVAGMYHVIVDERTSRFYPPESSSFYRPLYGLASKMPSIIAPRIVYVQRKAPIKSRLLRVCVDSGGYCNTFQQLNLRFLDQASDYRSRHTPWPISLFWSLQTLKLFSVIVPSEIWKMPQLRHIEVLQSMYLPDPPKGDDAIVLHNLHTLKTVEKLIFSEELCRSIPNIKYLEIEYNFVEGDGASWCFDLHNVGCLNKLEELKCFCSGMEYLDNPVQNLNLPNSLKELSLVNYHLVWSDMAMFASLPHLQILQLHNDEGVGAEWNCVEEEFRSLKHLNIGYCHDLVHWNAEKSNFPVLETLSLSFLSKLEEIPSSIGEIATLERMDVYKCSRSATISAIRIIEEQESLGNQDLQVRLVISQDKAEADMWREKYPVDRLLIPTYTHSNSFRSSVVVYDSIPRTS